MQYYNSFKSFKEPVCECLQSTKSILLTLPVCCFTYLHTSNCNAVVLEQYHKASQTWHIQQCCTFIYVSTAVPSCLFSSNNWCNLHFSC